MLDFSVLLLFCVVAQPFTISFPTVRRRKPSNSLLALDPNSDSPSDIYVEIGSSTETATDLDPDLSVQTADFSLDGDPYQLNADTLSNQTSLLLEETEDPRQNHQISRRKWISAGVGTLGALCAVEAWANLQSPNTPSNKKNFLLPKGNLVSPNLTKVVQETKINITMECTTSLTCVSLDTSTFQKKQSLRLPAWLPPGLVPSPRVIRDITNTELLVAATVAGSAMEITRTSILYPIVTLKTRIQTDVRGRQCSRPTTKWNLKRRIRILQLNAIRHYREGNLFAGITPTLLVAVPATGIYCGVRDVVRRRLTTLDISDVSIAVTAAFLADVIALAIRTPADSLALRLQSASGAEVNMEEESEEEREAAVEAKVGSWFSESIERLPYIILTDLPYLLSRIALNRLLIHGPLDIGRYELLSISTALLCGFLTTPFDVVRTRLLVDSDDDPTNGVDGGFLGTREGFNLFEVFDKIMKEGNGGVSNLFAGWFERIIYLGIGRAWLEPLQIVGYIALRDAILLEWFD